MRENDRERRLEGKREKLKVEVGARRRERGIMSYYFTDPLEFLLRLIQREREREREIP